jgi:hypothetical protein
VSITTTKKKKLDSLIERANKRDKLKYVTMSARVTTDFHDKVIKLCNEKNIKINGLMKALIEDFVDEYCNERKK